MVLKSAVVLQKECFMSPPRFLGHHLLAHGAKKCLAPARPTQKVLLKVIPVQCTESASS